MRQGHKTELSTALPKLESRLVRSIGWKDNKGWVAVIVIAVVAIHEVADILLPLYLNPVLSVLVIVFGLSLVAVCIGFSVIKAHRSVQAELNRAIQGKDALHGETSGLLDRLNRSLADTEQHNEQLKLLGSFNHSIHACDSEQELLALVQQLLPPIVQSRTGALFCPTPEGAFERTVHWPEMLSSETTIHRQRCEALRKMSRLESEFAPCYGCHLPDPSTVCCIPLRLGRKTAGLLQLTFPEPRSRAATHSAQESILKMAADQLALALLNATARKDLGDKVMRDGLTGAFNRRYMEEALHREIARSVRSKSPLSVLMLDLDHFKLLNDSMGHAAGDLVLKELAKTLSAHLRTSDIVCRYGGEEFLVALPDTSSVAAKGRADELRRCIHEISKVVKHQHVISASIGVAAMPEHGTDLKTLLRAADDALYDAKHSGRDRSVIAKSTKAPALLNFYTTQNGIDNSLRESTSTLTSDRTKWQ